ncbi:MAG TPA: peptidase dimerization domain-containing protein [Chloroflexota bacterium]|jgi:acetylornithine deacetylase/succinyl-diaminopimelate desuccinylase-like protein
MSEAVTEVAVQPRPLSAEQQAWLERAWAEIDEERMRRLLAGMVEIPSPTGEERPLAEYVAAYLRDAGLEGRAQLIDAQQANAIGRLRGAGSGPDLLLYAPLDTDFTGNADEDCPGVGLTLPRDLEPRAESVDGYVVGLGAVNPKGFATCVVSAAEAVRRAGVPLQGDVLVGLGAGGMPTNRRPTESVRRWNAGQGSGASFMLEQGVRGDFAIIAKPGWAVAWEEVGLTWFKIQVHGRLGYVGTRHTLPYRNPLVGAATLIHALEEWFPEYAARNASGLVAPQGIVGAIEGGWPSKPSFIPATCTLWVDLRIGPRTDPMDAKQQLGAALARIKERHGLDLTWEMVLSIPASHTDPNNWIVQSCMRGWERLEGKPHAPTLGTSGATDANILRGRGVPTARVGLPRAAQASVGGRTLSARAGHLASMRRLVQCLIYSIVDTCTRSRAEVSG